MTPPAAGTSVTGTAPFPAPATSSAERIASFSVVKSEGPSAEPLSALISRSPELSVYSAPPAVSIPSFSAWFSWDEINETERKLLPEFFDGKSALRNPSVYKYYRDSIIKRFRTNPSRKITFTDARRGLVGDVGSVRMVFDLLDAWGLINYTPVAKPALKERRGEEGNLEKRERPKRICTNCKSVCSLACFATDKYSDIVLCARCFVRGNYCAGLSSTDFKRVDITEDTRTEWTDKETLHLLEAILQYGEDWKKVTDHVGGRAEKDCIARFIKLPFGEQFLGPPEFSNDSNHYTRREQTGVEHGDDITEPDLSKRPRLNPLKDASNPIMAQVAFLSAVVGSEVAEAASRAAIAALHSVDKQIVSVEDQSTEGDALKEALVEARMQLEEEEQDVEKSISDIGQVQIKKIQEKIAHFEELELQVEKERLQLQYTRDLFFADQLNILRHKAQTVSTSSQTEKSKVT